MLAPPITHFFSPISSITTGTTTITTQTRIALKPTLLTSGNSSMNQKKQQLPATSDAKLSTTTNKESRSSRSTKTTTTSQQTPSKRQRLDPEGNQRVTIPLRANNTLVRSQIDGSISLSGITHQQKDPRSSRAVGVQTLNRPPVALATENKALNIEQSGSGKKDDNKRSLRSHDGGSRSKSELAQYFPNFDEIINPEVKEREFLTPETRLFITDEPRKSSEDVQFVLPTPTRTRAPSLSFPLAQKPPPPPPTISFERIELPAASIVTSDPLAVSNFEVCHRRAERQEKQLRNIERERAQHEKVQLERLQEGLLGPDWLKVMGISGVTEGDRKKWDDARDYFLKEVKSLLGKFARWKDEERRRKLVEIRKRREAEEEEDEEEEEEEGDSAKSSPDPAAQQLQLEIESASVGGKRKAQSTSRLRKPSKRARDQVSSPPPTPSKRRSKPQPKVFLPPIPTGPFLSFFAKPHQRAQALDKSRRAGRTRWAFGHPVPDMPEKAFSLPADYTSDEFRKISARLRRGMKRSRA